MKSLAYPLRHRHSSWQLRIRLAVARAWVAIDHNDALVWSIIFLCACYLFIRIAGVLP